MTSLAGRTLSHYKVLEEINRGGMGIVYRALDVNLSREVALKVLPPELVAHPERRRRFLQEARAAAALVDARIAVIHEVDEAEGVTFLAMELIRGEKLAHLVARGALPADRALDLAIEVAEGLAKAHERGIVHRDLKPGNVMVTEDGHAKIIDFGLAKLTEPLSDVDSAANTSPHLDTDTGVVMGTAAYMSPEQARGRSLDRRTDVFSFGIVLYEMLTGFPPFRGEGTFDTLQAIVNAPLPPLGRSVGGAAGLALAGILEKCLAKKPEDRYQGVADLLVDLRAARLRLESSPSLPAWRPGPLPRLSRRVMRRAGGLAVLLAALAGAVVAVRGWRTGGTVVRSVVALPSRVHAGEADAFLTDAIPNTISTYLNQVEGLETKLPPSSVDLARIGGDLGKAAEVYQVNAFVLSSVAVQADHLALTVQLVEPRSRRLLWSREYEGSRAGYLHLVREAAEGVREAVRPAASPLPTPAASSEVELVLQRGRHHLSRYGALYRPEDADRALAAFQRVLELDPRRAEAAAGTAVLFTRKFQSGDRAVLPEMESWAHRALELDSRASQAWTVLSYAEYARSGGSPKALDISLRAAAYGSQDPLAQSMLGGMLLGNSLELALNAFSEASRLDPLYFNASVIAAATLDRLDRRREALALTEQVLRVEPDAPGALLNRARWLSEPSRAREREDVLRVLDVMAAQGRLNAAWVALLKDFALLARGDRSALARVLQVAGGKSGLPAWEWFTLDGVVLLARLGRTEDALDVLVRFDAAGGVVPYDMLVRNPRVSALRSDPRFAAIASRSRVRFQETLQALDAARARGELPSYLEKPLADVRSQLSTSSWKRAVSVQSAFVSVQKSLASPRRTYSYGSQP